MIEMMVQKPFFDWAMFCCLMGWFGVYRWRLWLSLLLILLVVLCGVVQLWIFGLVIDEYMLGTFFDLHGLGQMVLMFFAVVVLEYILGGFQLLFIMICGIGCVGALGGDVYWHVMR